MPVEDDIGLVKWADVEDDDRFKSATPDQKLDVFREWDRQQGELMTENGLWNPQNYTDYLVKSEAKKRELLGIEGGPEDVVESVKHRLMSDQSQRINILKELSGQSELNLATEEQQLRMGKLAAGEEDTVQIADTLFVNPYLYLEDKDEFVRRVNEKPGPRHQKAQAVANYDIKRQEQGEAFEKQLLRDSIAYRSFRADNPDLDPAAAVKQFRESGGFLKKTESIVRGAIEGAAAVGEGGFALTAMAANMVGADKLRDEVESILDKGADAMADFAQTTALAGEDTFINELTSGAFSWVPSIVGGGLGASAGKTIRKVVSRKAASAVAPLTRKLAKKEFIESMAFTGMVVGGAAQETGNVFYEAYEGWREQLADEGMEGEELEEEARSRAIKSAGRAGLVVGAITTLLGKTGFESISKLSRISRNPASQGVFKRMLSKEIAKVPKAKLLFDVGKGAVAEGVEEALSEGLNAAFDQMSFNPDMTLDEFVTRTTKAGRLGATLGGIASGVTSQVQSSQQRRLARDLAERESQAMDVVQQLDEVGSPETADALQEVVEGQTDQAVEEAVAQEAEKIEQEAEQVEQAQAASRVRFEHNGIELSGEISEDGQTVTPDEALVEEPGPIPVDEVENLTPLEEETAAEEAVEGEETVVEPEETAEPEATESKGASVPAFITNSNKRKLRDKGFTEDQVRSMKPGPALEILENDLTPGEAVEQGLASEQAVPPVEQTAAPPAEQVQIRTPDRFGHLTETTKVKPEEVVEKLTTERDSLGALLACLKK